MRKGSQASKAEMLRQNRELFILSEISQTANQAFDLHEILNNSLDRISALIDGCLVGLYLMDAAEKSLIFTAQRGFSQAFSRGMRRLAATEGITGKAARDGEPMFIEDYAAQPEALPPAVQEGIESLVVIPLRSKSEFYGTLNVAWKEPHAFSLSEKNLMGSIGQVLSSAIERAYLYIENVKRLEEQKTLYSISQEIASRLESKEILQKIMGKVVDLLGVEFGGIILWDNRRQAYTNAIVHGVPDSLLGTAVIPGGIMEEVCSKKVPVIREDYESHPRRREDLDSYHIKEVLAVPLTVREMIIGVMWLGTTNPQRHFQQNEVDLINNFAHQAAIAIGNARLYEESLRKIKRLTMLYEIGKALSSTLDIDELLKKALELVSSSLGYRVCSILFLDRQKDELYIKQVSGRDLEAAREMRFKVGLDGIVGWVAKTGEPLYVPDVSKETRYISRLAGMKSEAAFPLKVRDRVIGVFNVESEEEASFDEEDLKLLGSFASQVSISIENAWLFSDLKQTLKELKQAQDQIIQAEKLRALGEMASGVAHDFNNVLAVVLGNLQLLLHTLGQLTPDQIREELKSIERSAKDGAETIRRIQEFAGMRRDREFTSVSLNQLATEVASITQPRWRDQPQNKGIKIELTKNLGDIPSILGNPSELREVLTNIVFNAVDAMPTGGQITVTTQPQAHDWVEVRIADTGVGMTEEVKRRVFDPFFTTKGVTNSGLGMSVSYGIIKRHGGEVLIESEPGKGTTFVLHLPVGYGEEDPEVHALKASRGISPARILVIDDDPAVRDILARMLRTRGHQVTAVGEAEEGVERFQKEGFDLVFTDLGMPRLSGWEVGKAIKGMNAKTPVAVITGWGLELNREEMRESGIDLIVSKPFNFDELGQVVAEAMELREKM